MVGAMEDDRRQTSQSQCGGRAALQVLSVSHRFANQEVLRDVSLRVEAGDCYGLLGHNGAGKTTLLRIALGLLKPRSGSVAVENFNIHRFPREARARLGGLIEVPRFHEGWSGLKNLSVWARLQGFDRTQSRAEAERVLALVGLDHLDAMSERKRVRDYSQGMQQRLGIAQGLIGQPPCILLDEPMNGLDPQAIVEMRSLIRRLIRDEGVAVVLSSHHLAEVSGLCNRIAILRKGRLLVEDTMEGLLNVDKKQYRVSLAVEPEKARVGLDAFDVGYQLEDGNGNPKESTLLVDLGKKKPAALTRHLLDHQIDLLALTPCEPSLEEVYLRLDAQAREESSSQSPDVAASKSPCLESPSRDLAPRWPFLRGMRYELTRLLNGARIGLLFALPAFAAGLSIVMMYRDAVSQTEQVGREVFSTTQMTAFDGVGRGLKVGLPMLLLLLAGLAGLSVAGEQSKGTLRYLLLRPIRRHTLALSKFAALITIGLAGYLLLVITSLTVSAYCLDFTDLAEVLPNGKLFPLVKREVMFDCLWSLLGTTILPLLAYASLGFAFGSWIKTNIGALVTTLGAVLVLDLGRAFVPTERVGWLLSAHMPSPLGGHSFVQYYCDSVQGVSNAVNPHVAQSLTTPLLWLALSMVLAVIALKRKAG